MALALYNPQKFDMPLKENKFCSIVVLLFSLVTNIRHLLNFQLFNMVQSIDPSLFNIQYCLLK